MAQRVISFHYTLTDTAGKVLDSSKGAQPFSFIEGVGQIVPGLEKELVGLNKGDKKKINVPAAEAYGQRIEELVARVPKAQIDSPAVKIGDRFRGGDDAHSPVFVVTEVTGDEVVLDGNHPLAGKDLVFDVEMIGAREVTAQEIEHGHAHGEHGHAH